MSANSPKLMLKVELPNKTDVKFTLIQITNSYAPNLKGTKFFFSKNNWTIYFGNSFHINKKNIICFPEKCSRQETKIRFSNDNERYEYMKELVHALEDWSSSHLFDNVSWNRTKINFHKTIWIIF